MFGLLYIPQHEDEWEFLPLVVELQPKIHEISECRNLGAQGQHKHLCCYTSPALPAAGKKQFLRKLSLSAFEAMPINTPVWSQRGEEWEKISEWNAILLCFKYAKEQCSKKRGVKFEIQRILSSKMNSLYWRIKYSISKMIETETLFLRNVIPKPDHGYQRVEKNHCIELMC